MVEKASRYAHHLAFSDLLSHYRECSFPQLVSLVSETFNMLNGPLSDRGVMREPSLRQHLQLTGYKWEAITMPYPAHFENPKILL